MRSTTADLATMSRPAPDCAQIRARATETVDLALKGSSETYIALHRDRMIHNELAFARFELEQRAAKADREAGAVKIARAA